MCMFDEHLPAGGRVVPPKKANAAHQATQETPIEEPHGTDHSLGGTRPAHGDKPVCAPIWLAGRTLRAPNADKPGTTNEDISGPPAADISGTPAADISGTPRCVERAHPEWWATLDAPRVEKGGRDGEEATHEEDKCKFEYRNALESNLSGWDVQVDERYVLCVVGAVASWKKFTVQLVKEGVKLGRWDHVVVH